MTTHTQRLTELTRRKQQLEAESNSTLADALEVFQRAFFDVMAELRKMDERLSLLERGR